MRYPSQAEFAEMVKADMERAKNPPCAGCFGRKYLRIDTLRNHTMRGRYRFETCPDCGGTGNDKMKLVFDTETTGLPEFKLPSDDPCQPHVIQFAGILLDGQGNEVDVLSTLVKPRRDAVMHPKAFEAHGISLQQAYDEGIEATALLDWFMDAIGKVGLIIGHNVQFDVRLMRILSARWRGVKWDNPHPLFCTMKRSTALVNLPPTQKMIAAGRMTPKAPKLSEAYEHFFREPLEGAHDALVDVRASLRVYEHLMKNCGVLA